MLHWRRIFHLPNLLFPPKSSTPAYTQCDIDQTTLLQKVVINWVLRFLYHIVQIIGFWYWCLQVDGYGQFVAPSKLKPKKELENLRSDKNRLFEGTLYRRLTNVSTKIFISYKQSYSSKTPKNSLNSFPYMLILKWETIILFPLFQQST